MNYRIYFLQAVGGKENKWDRVKTVYDGEDRFGVVEYEPRAGDSRVTVWEKTDEEWNPILRSWTNEEDGSEKYNEIRTLEKAQELLDDY